MLEPVFFILIDNLVLGVETTQLGNGSYPRGVVGCDCGTLEALVEDARSEADAFGVVGCAEDFTLDLGTLGKPKIEGLRGHTRMRSIIRCRGTAILRNAAYGVVVAE
jgi:hypothetical protein